MNKEIAVIIGGPGTGKTSLINHLTQQGHCCYPEISRQVTLEAQQNGIAQLFLEQPLLFSEMLLEGRKKQFENAQNETAHLVFIDRGLPDVLAYMHYIGDSYPKHFIEVCQKYQYTKIFILPPWEHIYVSDNERYENFEQSQLIHKHLVATYQDYGYQLIEVPKDTVAKRTAFILNHF